MTSQPIMIIMTVNMNVSIKAMKFNYQCFFYTQRISWRLRKFDRPKNLLLPLQPVTESLVYEKIAHSLKIILNKFKEDDCTT